MDQREYERFRSEPSTAHLIAAVEIGGPDRTLAYGYTVERDSWHAYLKDGELHVFVYDEHPRLRRIAYLVGESLDAVLLRPSKRVYPDTVDLTFARIMRDRGFDLPFYGNFDFESVGVRSRAALGAFMARTAAETFS